MVIDASVVVEYLVSIRWADQATRIFRRLTDPAADLELWAPDLIFVECASALRRLVATGAIDGPAGGRAVDKLPRLPIQAAGTAALIEDVWKLRATLTAYDACYVALASRLGATLVTADRALARACAPLRPPAVFLGELR